MTAQIAGVDGCRGGWVVARMAAEGTGPVTVSFASRLEELTVDLDSGALCAVGVDIPMGLPESGPRRCDTELRRFLGARRSSVFPAPIRALLADHLIRDYRAARDTSVAHRGKSLSIQSFNLLPKIAEADGIVRGGRNRSVIEVHPEAAFTEMNDGVPLANGKKTAAGVDERWALLTKRLPGMTGEVPRVRGAATDDVVDAIAALWSTVRWRRGEAHAFGNGEVDGVGIPMRIFV